MNIETLVERTENILTELSRLNKVVEDIRKSIGTIDKKLAITQTELKLKAGVFGFIGSAIPVTIMIILALLKGLF